MSWPPTLDDLKDDRSIADTDDRDHSRLQSVLDAAVACVERWRKGDFQFDPNDPAQAFLPPPTADVFLGTVRLAGRLHQRRESPDAMVSLGDLGTGTVPSFDVDIDRLLRIGRFQKPRVG